jgi:hypothetical protein
MEKKAPQLTACAARASPMNVSTAVAASRAPEFDTSLVGIANVAAVGAMPSAAAVCVRVAAAMPVAMNTALHEHAMNTSA